MTDDSMKKVDYVNGFAGRIKGSAGRNRTARPFAVSLNGGRAAARLLRRLAAAGLAAISVFSLPAQAFAGTRETKENPGYSDEEWAKLTDDVLEYDEVMELVHNFNTTMSETWDTLDDTKNDLLRVLDDLASSKRAIKERKDEALDEGDLETYVTAYTNEVVVNAVMKGLSASAHTPLSKVSSVSLTKAEKQITMYAQSALISYDSVRQQREILTHLLDVYERQYEIEQRKLEIGMSTAQEVLTAKQNVLSTQSSIQTIDAALASILPTICTLTGWQADETPEIAPIPSVDVSLIDEMDLEADTIKAIGSNETLKSQRTSTAANTYAGDAARLAVINQGDQQMTIKMESLYSEVQSALAAYEAACDGMESAQISADSYQKMYELGSLSESEYLLYMVSYYQEKANFASADTALRLAIETYGWAKEGLVDPD